MSIRFPTEAANADFLGDDVEDEKSRGVDRTRRANASARPEHFQRSDQSRESLRREARTDRGVSQAAFMNDKDGDKP